MDGVPDRIDGCDCEMTVPVMNGRTRIAHRLTCEAGMQWDSLMYGDVFFFTRAGDPLPERS